MDAVLYYISGESVGLDGRLAANRGSWEFRFWSPESESSVGISVRYDGTVRRSVLSSDHNPEGFRPAIPDGWLDSMEIYSIVCAGCGSWGFGIAVLNLAHPDYGDGQPLWMLMNLDNRLVTWDGVPVDGPG